MRKTGRIIVATLGVIAMLVCTLLTAFAHSGRTDSSGGHKDNKNKSGLGYYHYHCGGYSAHLHTDGYCPYTDVFPRSVSISVEKKVLKLGEKISITGAVSPSNACNTKLTWSCSDSSVIDLSNGVITAKKYGSAVITAESFNGKSKSVTITVKEITATKVEVIFAYTNRDIYIGDKFDLSANITPADVDNPSIVWKSDNEAVAKVNQNGRVETLAEGTVTISATASNGVVGKYKLNVKEKYVETVSFEQEEMELGIGRGQLVKAVVLPNDATFPQLSWSSSDASVATVNDNGEVKAKACGTAIITATSTNGISASVTVEVVEIYAEKIEITGEKSVRIGQTLVLGTIIVPEDATIRDVVWASKDETIATVDENGVVTAKKVGSVAITAAQNNVIAAFDIQVLPIDVERIVITADTNTALTVGDYTVLDVTVYPENATYPDVIWYSSDESVAVVNESGLVEAVGLGTAIVTAETKDGGKETTEIKVRMTGLEMAVIALVGVLVAGGGTTAAVVASKKRR